MNQDKAIYLENKYFSPATKLSDWSVKVITLEHGKNGMMRFIMPKAKI